MTAFSDQQAILRFLETRALSDRDERFCTLKTLREGAGLKGKDHYLRTILDDLEISGLINTRQMYQASGGRLFQISGKGLDLLSEGKGNDIIVSSNWTGHYEVSPAQRDQVVKLLGQIRSELDGLDLPNAKKANAVALVRAAEVLCEAAEPPWPIIMRILRSSELSGILSIASVLISIYSVIAGS